MQIRLRQLLWFASNQPKHEVLAGPFASPDPRVAAGTDEYKQIRQVWLKHLADEPKDPVPLNHATNFLRFSDSDAVESALQSGIDETDKAAVFQGDLYSLASLRITSVDPVTAARPLPEIRFQTPLSPNRPDPFSPGRTISASRLCARRNKQCRSVAGEGRAAAGRLRRLL